MNFVAPGNLIALFITLNHPHMATNEFNLKDFRCVYIYNWSLLLTSLHYSIYFFVCLRLLSTIDSCVCLTQRYLINTQRNHTIHLIATTISTSKNFPNLNSLHVPYLFELFSLEQRSIQKYTLFQLKNNITNLIISFYIKSGLNF